MNDHSVPRLQARDPGDIAQIVPHLIGFQPHESLVVIVTLQGRVQVTARADLADVQAPGRAEDLLDRIWSRFPTAGAHLVAYTSDRDTGWALLRRCENHLPPFADRGSMIIDADTWHSPDGESGPVDPHGRLAAEAAYLGLAVLPSRAELDGRFASADDTPAVRAAQDRALATLPDPGDKAAIADRVRTLLARNLPDPKQRVGTADVSQVDALQLAALVAAGTGRDLALVSISRDNADQHLQLWRRVVNQTPASGAEMPLYLAGMAAWVSATGPPRWSPSNEPRPSPGPASDHTPCSTPSSTRSSIPTPGHSCAIRSSARPIPPSAKPSTTPPAAAGAPSGRPSHPPTARRGHPCTPRPSSRPPPASQSRGGDQRS